MTIIRNIFNHTLELRDPIGFVTSNGADNRLARSMLEKQYVGKCFKSCYVLRLVRILRVGPILINQGGVNIASANPVMGYIDVQFEVEGLQYYQGEIISGCEVVNKADDNTIIAESRFVNVYIEGNKLYDSIAAGQTISVVVKSVVYDVMQDKISISATLWVPSGESRAYLMPSTVDTLSADVRALIAELENEALSDKTDSALWKNLMQLTMAYDAIGVNSKSINIIQYLKSPLGDAVKPPKYIVRDAHSHAALPLVVFSDTADNNNSIELLTSNEVYLAILRDYKNNRGLIRDMAEIYSSEKMLVDHTNLWKIYGACRKRLSQAI